MLALLMMGISSIATSPIMDLLSDDDGGDDPDADDGMGDVQTPDLSLLELDDPDTEGSIGPQVPDDAPGTEWLTLVSDDAPSEAWMTLVSEDAATETWTTLVSDDAPDEAWVTLVSEDPTATSTMASEAPPEEGESTDMAEDEFQPWPEAEMSHVDGDMTELAAFDVGLDGASAEPADITGFVRGEHLLDITIFAEESVGELDVEITASENGEDSLFSANGQVLAILRGVPDAEAEDFRISIEAPQMAA